ncbi:MAG: DUF58 domain-containing protein [Campylobacterota bacterium]|nr:DUF58 domain-containing protein [Campylobacterota bacterium]
MHSHTLFRTLLIKARQQVHTLLSGNSLSKLHGEGYDLSELREYQVGDDVRKINWIITAKMGRAYIKELHANRELSIVVTSMLGGSLYFGDGDIKQEKLAEVTMLLGYAAQQNADLFTGLGYLQNHTIFAPPTKQLYSIESFFQKVYSSDTIGTSVEYNQAIDDIFRRVERSSLIFIVGDFLQEVDLSLLAQKHEVIAIVIRDRAEEQPQKLGEVILENPQNYAKIETHFGQKSIDRYLAKLQESDKNLIEHFSKYGIRYTKIYTDEEPIAKLIYLFG